MKKKWIILTAALLLILAAVVAISWQHTTALGLFPEGEWESAVCQRFLDDSQQEIDHEQLREIMENQHVWYGGGLDFLPKYCFNVTIDGEDWLLGVSEGYTAVIPAEGEANASQYRDDGSLYQALAALMENS